MCIPCATPGSSDDLLPSGFPGIVRRALRPGARSRGYVADAAQSVGFDPTAGQTSYSWTTVTLHPGDCTTNSVENMAVVVSSSHHAMVSGVTFAGRTLANMNIPADTTGVGDAYVGVFYGACRPPIAPRPGR